MSDIYNGDVFFFDTQDSGEIFVSGGQPKMDKGLETAVYISLGCGPSWINEVIPDNRENERTESRLDELERTVVNNKTRLDAEQFTIDSLQWMIRENIAKTIDVEASIVNINRIQIDIVITKPNQTHENFKYLLNWNAQESDSAITSLTENLGV